METKGIWDRQTYVNTQVERRDVLIKNLLALFKVQPGLNEFDNWKAGLLERGKAPVSVFMVTLAYSGLNLWKLCERAQDRALFPEREQNARMLWEQESYLRGNPRLERDNQEDIIKLMNTVIPKTRFLPRYRLIVPATFVDTDKYVYKYCGGQQYQSVRIPSHNFSINHTEGLSYLEYEYIEELPNSQLVIGKRNPFFRIQGALGARTNLHVNSYFSMGLNTEISGIPPYPHIPFSAKLTRTLMHLARKKIN